MTTKLKKVYRGIKYSVPLILDRRRKSSWQILKELNHLKDSNSFKDLRFYFFSLMHLKDAGDINNYANFSEQKKIRKLQKNNIGIDQDWTCIDDKIKFTKHMVQNHVSLPHFLGLIELGNIYDYHNNLSISLTQNKNVVSIFKTWLEQYKTIFIKESISSHGKAVWRIANPNQDITFLKLESKYLIQEGIEQHAELKKVNPKCVNTLRVITYLDKGKKPLILCSMLRSGVGDSYIDNKEGKFIFVNYNLFLNKMDDFAKSEFPKYGIFSEHPDTNFIFSEASLPYPDQVIVLVTKAAMAFPERKLIGWDIAYTEHGPVIIEGNTNPGVQTVQICLKGIKNNQKYEEMINNC